MRTLLATAIALLSVGLLIGQEEKPEIFDVSEVTAGAKRIETLYFYGAGKWSDADSTLGVLSTEIHCYKTFLFCEEADARLILGQGTVGLDTYDILRWDSVEL